jgi:hypothetical protein
MSPPENRGPALTAPRQEPRNRGPKKYLLSRTLYLAWRSSSRNSSKTDAAESRACGGTAARSALGSRGRCRSAVGSKSRKSSPRVHARKGSQKTAEVRHTAEVTRGPWSCLPLRTTEARIEVERTIVLGPVVIISPRASPAALSQAPTSASSLPDHINSIAASAPVRVRFPPAVDAGIWHHPPAPSRDIGLGGIRIKVDDAIGKSHIEAPGETLPHFAECASSDLTPFPQEPTACTPSPSTSASAA